MVKPLILVIFLTQITACSLISMTQRHYKPDTGQAPKEKLLSFKSQEAMKAGSTLNSAVAAEVYYLGTEPKSKQAKILYDMSYRFLAFIGVNANYDMDDPDALKKTFEEADKAIEEKERNLSELRQAVDDYRTKLDQEKKIVRDKEAEMLAQNGKWSTKFGSLFYGIIIFIVILLIGALLLQVYTGIPIFSGLITGSIKTAGNAIKQTVAGVQDIRDELRKTKEDPSTPPEAREQADKWLGKLDNTLSKHHDESVKKFVYKVKEKL